MAERKGSHLICKDDVKHEHSVNKYTRMFYSKRICLIKFPSEATFSCLNATKKKHKMKRRQFRQKIQREKFISYLHAMQNVPSSFTSPLSI